MSAPPRMFPIVTGRRFAQRNLAHVRFARFAGIWCAATNAWFDFTRRPMGMKNMFATLCSKPDATNAEIGGMIARILSVVVRALYASQTARQTSALQNAASAIACTKPRLVLPLAIATE